MADLGWLWGVDDDTTTHHLRLAVAQLLEGREEVLGGVGLQSKASAVKVQNRDEE